ncbi:Aminopeptidase [Enhygromyxa salina]|uniref:Aminopeptidase n=1 Tax=Enhygromyxa salina TaxID=215803 RepID=A0A0C2CKW1_9BACT|nr:M20/M25/M40 family metallo-hydrolase [Enhygromyxa salina]KIG11861.1 Aminopeptidase [Enhygromyxa salina]
MPNNFARVPGLLGVGLLACLAGCRPEPPTLPPADDGIELTAAPPIRPTVDASGMFASIEWLASDERQGRYTLDGPQIEAAASWISQRYEQLGLEPVDGATSMRLGYRLRTKVEAGKYQALIVQRKGKPVEIGAEQFSPRGEGVSGTAEGEVVFVGYGLSWTREAQVGSGAGSEAESGHAIDSYDDLSGQDLTGKIALVLAHAPNTLDLMALFGAMQKLSETFEADAAPLREANATAKLEKLHKKVREDLVDLVEPFVDPKLLGDSYWKVEDPKARLDLTALASVFMAQNGDRPKFDLREASLTEKAKHLAAAGAVGVIFVQGPRSFVGKQARDADLLPGVSDEGLQSSRGVLPDPAPIPVVQLRWKQADKLFSIGGEPLSKVQAAIDGDYQPRSQALGVTAQLKTELIDDGLEVPNVLAQLRGETEEIVMIGAHFDHIGTDELGSCRAIVRKDDRDAICNGADDNASGTAMLLELARAYKQAGVTPKRTIVFAHFSGEELGLLGSHAMIESSPFDQGQVVAMVNLDMVGRLGPRGLAIGGLGSSDDWMPLLDELGNYGMEILYEGSTTTRSDHAWWFRRQIPVLFFFTGMHGDYHRAGDEIDEINVEGLGTIGQLVSDVIWELAGGRAINWTAPKQGDGIGRGLPGSDPTSVIRRVDVHGNVVEVEPEVD